MAPVITSIAPSVVDVGWVGTLHVTGTGFNSQSAVMIDASFPPTTYVSALLMDATLRASDTATTGQKSVKVHQLDAGTLSNEVFLVVIESSR